MISRIASFKNLHAGLESCTFAFVITGSCTRQYNAAGKDVSQTQSYLGHLYRYCRGNNTGYVTHVGRIDIKVGY